MSDYDTDYDEQEDHDEDVEEDHSEDDDEPSSAKKSKKSSHVVKYKSDGLNDNDYRRSDVAHEDLVKAECCHNYFKAEAYAHQTQFKLSIQGINMCIHCFISFNLHKFADCNNLTKTEEDCLRYYIEKFTDDHASETCTRNKVYGKCLLCESKVGIKPKIFKKLDAFEVVESNHGSSNDPNNITTTDIVLINKTDATDFVLVL